jgi:hypothetical protein
MTDEAKILMTAVVTSLATVGVIEPIKAWLQRRRVRRWLYREMIHNCMTLVTWKVSACRYPEMQKHTAAQFASEYKRLAYDLAVKDAAFYALPNEEPYRIERIYRDFELIAQGAYEEAHECFSRAELAAAAMLLALKDRSLSKRVAFSVSTKQQKRYFRENLPTLMYINYDNPPSLQERLGRRYDAVQYRLWRKLKLTHKG